MAQQVEHVLGKDVFGVKTEKEKLHTQARKKACAAMAQSVEHFLGKDVFGVKTAKQNYIHKPVKRHVLLWLSR